MINFPKTFTKGTTVAFGASLADYPADEWDLTLTLVSPTDKQTTTATAIGSDYAGSFNKAASSQFTAGRYDWQMAVDNGTDRHIVSSGVVNVCEDFATQAGGFDARSQLEQKIAAMTAVIEDKASGDQQKVRYRDREVWRYPIPELIQIVQFLKRELAKEKQAARIASGMGSGNKIKVRF